MANGKAAYYQNKIAVLFWKIMVVAALALLLLEVVKILFSGKELHDQAVAQGQSFIITVANGQIEGKISTSPYQIAKEKTIQDTPATDSKISQAEPVFTTIISKEGGLNPAPDKNLIEPFNGKSFLPIVGKDGTLPWKYYSRPYNAKETKPLVAIVFTNLGLNKASTEEVIRLPHDFTFGVSAYAGDARKWATKAREEGFEVVIDLPMQAENYPLSDPGSFGLLEDLGQEENNLRLYGVLSQLPAFVGVTAPVGEKLTANMDFMKSLLLELKKRGILFLYYKTEKNKGLEDLAKTYGFTILGIDKVIDEDIVRSNIDSQLQLLVESAKINGYAIGLAHSYPPTLETLSQWTETLKAQHVDLVPVSAIAKRIMP